MTLPLVEFVDGFAPGIIVGAAVGVLLGGERARALVRGFAPGLLAGAAVGVLLKWAAE